MRGWVRKADEELLVFELLILARTQLEQPVPGNATGGLAGGVAHVAYHLGAIRQMVNTVL